VNSTDYKSPHKPTLTAGPSCLSATSNHVYMHVPRPLCYKQHTATGDVHTTCGSCCEQYRSMSISCLLSVSGFIGLIAAEIWGRS